MKAGVLIPVLLLNTALAAAAPDPALPAFDAGRALDASQAVIGSPIGDHLLTAADGRAVSLAEFRGRPLVISPIYTSCFHVCPQTTTYLARVTDMAASTLGEDAFAVLTVGFDTAHYTPERMRDFAQARGIDSPQSTFASGDQATVARLMTEIGFTYAASVGGFDHMVQATIVDAALAAQPHPLVNRR